MKMRNVNMIGVALGMVMSQTQMWASEEMCSNNKDLDPLRNIAISESRDILRSDNAAIVAIDRTSETYVTVRIDGHDEADVSDAHKALTTLLFWLKSDVETVDDHKLADLARIEEDIRGGRYRVRVVRWIDDTFEEPVAAASTKNDEPGAMLNAQKLIDMLEKALSQDVVYGEGEISFTRGVLQSRRWGDIEGYIHTNVMTAVDPQKCWWYRVNVSAIRSFI